ncbi:MAG: hydroxymethylbilane synthase [Spirosomaceae bacterium]|nr:hydroxymethylbilane synthase [Spirosomataceae bacterium]
MHIRIGTRGSKLALWQAYYIEEKLQAAGATAEIIIIETKGDKILDRALSKIGSKGVFTEELEEQLLDGRIDIAVHSAKDLQSDLGDDFEVIAFTEREKINDVLVSRNKELDVHSGEPFVIGTSSTRRIAMLRAYFPHLKVVDMRGNLQTRIRKLDENHCDALLLAYAGVHRMGYHDMIIHEFDSKEFTPAVGQGSVAVEVAVSLPDEKKTLVKTACNHPETERRLRIERAFLRTMNGGCSIPVFGLATTQDFTAGIISLDGKEVIRETVEVDENASAEELGDKIAKLILNAGGERILQDIRKSIS